MGQILLIKMPGWSSAAISILKSFKTLSTGGVSVFAGVGERTREGNDLYHEMCEAGVIKRDNFGESKIALVYCRYPMGTVRVPFTGLVNASQLAYYYSRINASPTR